MLVNEIIKSGWMEPYYSQRFIANARRLSHRAVIVMIVLAFSFPPLFGDDWNQWRGSDRTGSVAHGPSLIGQLPDGGLKPVWQTEEALTGGWASPIVANGTVFQYVHTRERREDVELVEPKFPPLSDEEMAKMEPDALNVYEENRQQENMQRNEKQYQYYDNVHAIALSDGSELWHKRWPGQTVRWGQSSTPAEHQGRLYVIGSDRKLHCLNSQNGEPQWATGLNTSNDLSEPIASSVAIIDGVVIVLAERLVGIDCENGHLLWRKDEDGFSGVYASPVGWSTAERTLAIVNVDHNHGETVAVVPKTGREIWRLDSGANRSTPVVIESKLLTYGSSRKSGLRCYDLSQSPPEMLWTYQRLADPGASPAVDDDRVIVAGDKAIACVSLEEGTVNWTESLDMAKARYTSPITACGVAIYAFNGLWLRDIHATKGTAVEARFGEDGLLATQEFHRKSLNLDELDRDPKRATDAEEIWQSKVIQQGPIDCTTPAIVDGYLVIRLRSGLACYDLSADPNSKRKVGLK